MLFGCEVDSVFALDVIWTQSRLHSWMLDVIDQFRMLDVDLHGIDYVDYVGREYVVVDQIHVYNFIVSFGQGVFKKTAKIFKKKIRLSETDLKANAKSEGLPDGNFNICH